MNEQFVVDEVQDVFELDCLTSSHPISVTVNHPDEINEIFDRISYGKGSSIIRMMNYLLGAESFQLGVSNYLKAMKFENADQDDLWNHLTEAQSLNQSSILEVVDVKNVMDSWTLQAGYPVVTLSRNYSTGMASVRQERFLLNHLNQSVDNSNYSWEIPVTYTTRSVAFEDQWSPVTKLWLHKEAEKEISTAGIASAGDWMIANVQQVGYYRVNYDQVNWQLIIDQLRHNHSRIHVNNRAQIVDDSLDLARAGLVDYAIPLEICRYLVNETDHVPWEAATAGFTFLDLMLRRTALYGQWKEFALALTSALYDRVGWEIAPKEDVLRQYVQETALSWACKYNHQGCIEKARTLFTDWKSSVIKQANNTIYPNWRQFVYCTAIKHGTEQDWSFLWSVYTQTQDASERDKLMGALACSKQPWILRRYITWAFTENGYIRRQDGSTVFRAVAANDYGRDLAYSYLQENWNSIVKYYGKSFFSFGSLVKAVTSSLTTDYEVTELKKFYETVKHNVGTAQRSFLQAIEKAEANADWTNNYYARIESWLTENGATVA
ncbi:Aminopeptidase N [Halotydeus destructor]|nr:Aminopeptidase N [Halotydeus destructor]